MSIPGFDHPDISQFVGNFENRVDDCVFHINADHIESADFWVCLEGPYKDEERCRVKKTNVFFLTAEVAWPRLFYDSEPKKNYLAQFGHIYTCHDIYANNVTMDLPFLPWMINANHGQSVLSPNPRDCNYFKSLDTLIKTKSLSVFCSDQNWTADHKLRLKFTRALKKHFGEHLDWFGNGVQPINEKWQGIAPYKYHIVLENQSRYNVITEKMYDAFLGLSYPIYYGAPNIDNYFDPQSFSKIDITDLNGTIKIIEKILEIDPYEQALPAIIKSKNRVLNENNLFVRIAKICKDQALKNAQGDANETDFVALRQLIDFNAQQDLQSLLVQKNWGLLCDRLTLYYPSFLFRRISERLFKEYSSRHH